MLCFSQKKTPFFCLWTISLSCCFASANFIHTSAFYLFHGDLTFPDSTIPSTFSHQMEGRVNLSRRAATKNIKNPDGKLNFWLVTLSRSATLWNFLGLFGTCERWVVRRSKSLGVWVGTFGRWLERIGVLTLSFWCHFRKGSWEKNWIHVFWAFLSLQKITSMFFELF